MSFDSKAPEDQFHSSTNSDAKENPNPSTDQARSESLELSPVNPNVNSNQFSDASENKKNNSQINGQALLGDTPEPHPEQAPSTAAQYSPSVADIVLNQMEHYLHLTRHYVLRIVGNNTIYNTAKEDNRSESSRKNEESNNKRIHLIFFIGSTLTLTPFGQSFCKYILSSLVHFVLTVVGTTLGIGLGIGFASFIKEKLDHLDSVSVDDDDDEHVSIIDGPHLDSVQSRISKNSRSTVPNSAMRTPSISSNTQSTINHDTSNSYMALMTSAGYATHTHIALSTTDNHVCSNNTTSNTYDNVHSNVKGQILRNVPQLQIQNLTYISKPYGERNCIYANPTGEGDLDASVSKGIATCMRMWPNLPKDIINEIGKLEDYIARDYIMSWFASVDDSIRYENEVERRKRLLDLENTYATALSDQSLKQNNAEPMSSPTPTPETNCTMLLSTSTCRSSPFIEILYTSLTSVLGNFATLCENVNITKLVLVKFLHILKLNIKTYRDIRKNVLEKERKRNLEKERSSGLKVQIGIGSTNKNIARPTEISIVREYLLQGKFHKAVTFGLDVPSLLFGDSKGVECPIPSSHQDVEVDLGGNMQDEVQEDDILYQRLFGNNRRLLHECELDYNRVIAHRLSRILFPRADFASPLLRSAAIEMLASCVLTPSMGCFTPDYVNGWIVKGLQTDCGTSSTEDDAITASIHGEIKIIHGERIPSSQSSEVQRKDSIDDDYKDIVDELLDDDEDDDDNDYNSELDDTSPSIPESPELARIPDMLCESQEKQNSNIGDEILALLTMSLIELQAYVDFDEARDTHGKGEELGIRWNEKGCIETVRNLVLVIEATIMHGILLKKRSIKNVTCCEASTESAESDNTSNTVSSFDILHKYGSVTVLLMELTSDLDSFENEVKKMQNLTTDLDAFEDDQIDISSLKMPNTADLSTLRTLIAAWLHTGVIYRTLSVLMRAGDKVLHPFYHKNAFIRQSDYVEGFLHQLRSLHNVVILVDTMTVLSSEPLHLHQSESVEYTPKPTQSKIFPATSSNIQHSAANDDIKDHVVKVKPLSPTLLQSTLRARLQKHDPNKILSLGNHLGTSLRSNFDNNKKRMIRIGNKLDSQPIKMTPQSGQQQSSNHLDFHRNEAFASSLRIERNARMDSFEKMNSSSTSRTHVEMICRSRITSQSHFSEHRDLHALAKSFFYNTNMIALKHIKPSVDGDSSKEQTMLLFENVAEQQKLDLPDDDSSFLLRAQPRPLSVVNIHRDERSYNLSYKKYVAYFEEPIMHKKTSSFRGAKLRKRCFLRFYPSDRTAAINFVKSDRFLDTTLGRLVDIEISGESRQLKEFERYLCNKFLKKGSERGGSLAASLLASTVMDSHDFNAIPKAGKASDFVYRMNLYDEPEIELAGKRFVVQDASVLGAHQADASSLELSDASLSTALILGEKIDKRHNKHFHVKCDADGSPLAYLRVSEQQNETGSPLAKAQSQSKQGTAFRAYRLSFLRASLLVQSSRQEAQLQCLLSGTAKNASKAKIDSLLQRALSLLDHATSKTREKQSLLLRDLKLGINHIDRDQLRRNGLLNPRYPTKLNQLKATVESSIEVKTPGQNIDLLVTPTTVLYQIRCIAITEYIGCYDNDNSDEVSLNYGDLIREEWVVLRPFKDFNMLHKFLKTQVNPSESSAGTGAKLVGAAQGLATAALTLGSSSTAADTKRKSLVPSLSQAAKAGALGNTKKSVEKRKEILNGYVSHLLSPGNLLNRCPELLRFLGAYDPFPTQVKLNQGVIVGFTDNLGRCEMKRSLLRASIPKNISDHPTINIPVSSVSHDLDLRLEPLVENTSPSPSRKNRKRLKNNDPAKLAMISAIKSRIEAVKLSQVRGNVFELIRYTFDLDNNANFFRSQMVTALKTMTIAFTSAQSFKRILLDFHLRYVNGKNIAFWIKYVRDLIWPNGILFTSAPPLSKDESEVLANKSKILLREAFPEQLATVLGNEITESGIDLIHEMLQNRLVLKSICYMMYDELIYEITPEMGDVLTSHQVLDR